MFSVLLDPGFRKDDRVAFTFFSVIPARHERYAEISKQVMDVLRDFTPDVEEVSVDEAYMDLTGMSKFYIL